MNNVSIKNLCYVLFNYNISDKNQENISELADYIADQLNCNLERIFFERFAKKRGLGTFKHLIIDEMNNETKDFYRKALAEEITAKLPTQSVTTSLRTRSVTYYIGQRFKFYINPETPTAIYQLEAISEYQVILVMVETLNDKHPFSNRIWITNNDRTVKDMDNITQEEFDRIAGNVAQDFVPIKD